MINVFLLSKLIFKDLLEYLKHKKDKKPHKYGVYGFFGLPGAGKTMSMCHYLNEQRMKYKDNIYISTNFNYKYQDFAFDSYKDLLKEYDKTIIFAWDEIQNEFNSRDFKKFPPEFLTLLTQNRKGNGKQIIYTAQSYDRVDKVIRELTHKFYYCKSLFFARLTTQKVYSNKKAYILNNSLKEVKADSKSMFIQTDELRNCYNSYLYLDSALKRLDDDYSNKNNTEIQN